MNVQRIRDLIDLVAEGDLAELTVSDADSEVHIARGSIVGGAPGQSMATPAERVASAGKPAAGAVPSHELRASMTGTFRRGAKAGGEPLAEVGMRVERGTPLCVIEAMKIMNEIDADRAGTLARVLCEEGQAVEAGQPLFVID